MPSGAVDVVEGALERVQRACGTKKHAAIIDAIDAVRAMTRDGTFESLGSAFDERARSAAARPIAAPE